MGVYCGPLPPFIDLGNRTGWLRVSNIPAWNCFGFVVKVYPNEWETTVGTFEIIRAGLRDSDWEADEVVIALARAVYDGESPVEPLLDRLAELGVQVAHELIALMRPA